MAEQRTITALDVVAEALIDAGLTRAQAIKAIKSIEIDAPTLNELVGESPWGDALAMFGSMFAEGGAFSDE
jgi:hypothetical protein